MSNTTTTTAGFTLSQIAAMFEADEWQVSLPAAEEDADDFDAESEWDDFDPEPWSVQWDAEPRWLDRI